MSRENASSHFCASGLERTIKQSIPDDKSPVERSAALPSEWRAKLTLYKKGLSTFCLIRAQAPFPDFKNLEAIVLHITVFTAALLKYLQAADSHGDLLYTVEDSSLLRTFQGTVLFGYCLESLIATDCGKSVH